jgi:hypothetical protein
MSLLVWSPVSSVRESCRGAPMYAPSMKGEQKAFSDRSSFRIHTSSFQ